MTAASKQDETKAAAAEVVSVVETKEEVEPTPPLEAAARRLERLLGPTNFKDTYSNPAKLVKRWLGTSSGAAGKATLEDIQAAATKLLPPEQETLFKFGDVEMMETSSDYLSAASAQVQAWLVSLAVRILWKDEKYIEAMELCRKGIDALLVNLSSNGISTAKSSLFPLLARLYRYRSLVAESLHQTTLLRSDLIRAHNAACLRRDVDCQATLLNLLLRDLLASSQIEQAQKLLQNSTFPETASNNQLCRYLYHSGRIQALRLEYTSAFSNLSQCLRKAPTHTALGFRIAAQRLLVVVQLLMGEIPDRHVFFVKEQKRELAPYLAITQAVRRGDLAVFEQVVLQHKERLIKDETYSLISRLAHSVVKAGLRKLHVSYSRISLQDVADRLGLPSAASAEFVVAKAVRDGVLDATIHHTEKYVQSHELQNVYATTEPSQAFHRRIAYCLTTHNDALKAMRYPPDAYKKQLEASRGNNSGNQDKTDEEMAQELEDELEDDEY